MSLPLTGIASMATRHALAQLAALYGQASGREVRIQSVGGVQAAQRVQAGECFDIVVLAVDAIAGLGADGHVDLASARGIVRSEMAVAVRAGCRRPDIGSGGALRDAMLSAGRIGYSTGPSGAALLRLIDGWGLAGMLRDRLVQARPGEPVAALLANGTVDLGFQQLSELMDQPAVEVLGPMPPGLEIVTTFAGAVCTRSEQPADAQALLDDLCAPHTATIKRQHGLLPA